MNLKLVTLPYDMETGAFPPDPLQDIEGEILSVVEHFFIHAGIPQVLLLVHYRQYQEARFAAAKRSDTGLRAQLAEDERGLYDRLRAWRNGRAQAEGLPPYTLMTNRQAADIARRRPSSLSKLHQITGMGDARIRRFGQELLTVLASLTPALTQCLAAG